jgi:hypothetical protein
MTRSTYFDLGRSADARPGSESGYAQRFQCGNVVKRLIGTGMSRSIQCTVRRTRTSFERCEPPSSIGESATKYSSSIAKLGTSEVGFADRPERGRALTQLRDSLTIQPFATQRSTRAAPSQNLEPG